jgi:hypothetical protein
MQDEEGYTVGNAIVLGVPGEENTMPIERRQNGWTTLQVKVWNDGLPVADLIGSVTITIGANDVDLDYSRGHRSWYDLKPQGKLELTLHSIRPLAPEDLEVGMRVQRGPDWKYADQDGGMLKLADHEDEVRDRYRISSRTIDSAHPTLEAKFNEFANVVSIGNESEDDNTDHNPDPADAPQEEFTFGPFRCGTIMEVRDSRKTNPLPSGKGMHICSTATIGKHFKFAPLLSFVACTNSLFACCYCARAASSPSSLPPCNPTLLKIPFSALQAKSKLL